MRDYSGMRECAGASQTEIVALLEITVLFERRYLENGTSYRRDSKSIFKGRLCRFSSIKNDFFPRSNIRDTERQRTSYFDDDLVNLQLVEIVSSANYSS